MSPAALSPVVRPALFGKLPTHGDFVARGLEPAARTAWDGWLSEGLALARDALGEAFEGAHDTAPPWRFVLGADDLGEAAQAGCVAPSVDSAGRRFWIVTLFQGASDAAFSEAAESAVFDALGEGLQADALLERLACAEPSAVHDPRAGWWTEGGANHGPDAVPGGQGPALAVRMLTPDALRSGR